MTNNKKITVLVTGVFDLLHEEHINFLKKAKQLGDYLIVGIESDKRVKEIKGENRPINDQFKRMRQILSERIADKIIILPEKFSKKEHHLRFIKEINPDILAVSSHTAHLDKKEAIMKLVSGRLEVIHDHNPDISTSILLNKGRE